jgi:hypothetical protein
MVKNMLSLESIFNKREDVQESLPPVFITMEINEKTIRGRKNLKLCGKIGDLELIGKKFSIKKDGILIRQFTVNENTIDIISGNGELLKLPKELPVYYEEWFMDAGSYLFQYNYKGRKRLLKLATEYDNIYNE